MTDMNPFVPETVYQYCSGTEKIFFQLLNEAVELGLDIDREPFIDFIPFRNNGKKFYDIVLEHRTEIEASCMLKCLEYEAENDCNEERMNEMIDQIIEKEELKEFSFFDVLVNCIARSAINTFSKIIKLISEEGEERIVHIYNILQKVHVEEQDVEAVLELFPSGEELNHIIIRDILTGLVEYGDFQFVEKIIERGFYVDSSFPDRNRLLFSVIESGQNSDEEREVFFSRLLKLGANPNFVERDTLPPIFKCFEKEEYKIAKILISNERFDPTVTYQGKTVLESCKDKKLRKLILQKMSTTR